MTDWKHNGGLFLSRMLMKPGTAILLAARLACTPAVYGMSAPGHIAGTEQLAGMRDVASLDKAVAVNRWMDDPASKIGRYLNHRAGSVPVHPSNHGALRHNPLATARALSGTGRVDSEILNAARVHKLQDMLHNASPVDGWSPTPGRKRQARAVLKRLKTMDAGNVEWPEWLDRSGPLVYENSPLKTSQTVDRAEDLIRRAAHGAKRLRGTPVDPWMRNQARRLEVQLQRTGRMPKRLPRWLVEAAEKGEIKASQSSSIYVRLVQVDGSRVIRTAVRAGGAALIVVPALLEVSAALKSADNAFDAGTIDAEERFRRKSVAWTRCGGSVLVAGAVLLVGTTPIGFVAGGVVWLAVEHSGLYDAVGTRLARIGWQKWGAARFEREVIQECGKLERISADDPSALATVPRSEWAALGFTGTQQKALDRILQIVTNPGSDRFREFRRQITSGASGKTGRPSEIRVRAAFYKTAGRAGVVQ